MRNAEFGMRNSGPPIRPPAGRVCRARWLHSAFRIPHSALEQMDYLTVALLLVLVGVVLLGAEILLPTGGILVVGALLCFAVAVGTILYYGTALEATVALVGMAVGLPASGFAAVAAWRR